MLVDLQSGNEDRGICALPFTRQSDEQTVYIPMNIVGNLYVSNGMSAGNTRNEARVQGLSEVFERHIKNRIIAESISLPEIPADVLARYRAWWNPSLSWKQKVSQSLPMTARWAASTWLSASCCSTRQTAPVSPPLARTLTSAWRWNAPSPSCCRAVA